MHKNCKTQCLKFRYTISCLTVNEKLPVSIHALVWIPVNPLIESQWSILFTALDLEKLHLERSAHVSLLNESLPFPAALSVSSVSVLPPHPTPTPTLDPDFYWPTATFNYHGWKEKQIRAWNSEADSPSLTIQKENSSNEHSLLPSVEALDRVRVARGITR